MHMVTMVNDSLLMLLIVVVVLVVMVVMVMAVLVLRLVLMCVAVLCKLCLLRLTRRLAGCMPMSMLISTPSQYIQKTLFWQWWPHLAACLMHVVTVVNHTLLMVLVVVVMPVLVPVLMFVLMCVCVAVLCELRLLRRTCRLAGCALLLQLLLAGRLQPGLVDLHLQRVVGITCVPKKGLTIDSNST
jgi:hypothetical protein